ncbi:class I SAM-dependent methyltransferase [Carnobacterium funditum]|uniref:class I SAM-dependent methyltransferase n=1 Tax=Carnobacterium funditum TaxID=2752 RepID=UPI0005573FAE|nr:class I SAM-dependent methyltransferase [Carnobacterium funditum]
MSQKEIERLFSGLDTSVQLLQKELGVSYLEGLSETGENIIDGKKATQENKYPSDQTVKMLTELYQELPLDNMEPEEIRKSFQLALLKGAKSDQVQANHQMTPDAIGFILSYLIEKVIDIDIKKIRLLDPAVGTGNLLSTIYNGLTLKEIEVEAEGIDNDDLLLSLALINTELQGQRVKLTHQDALTDLLIDPVDIVVSDLPVGFYPIDKNAKRFKASAPEGHSYAHHLFIEQSIYYLKNNGYGVFLVPTQLFETKESAALTKIIQSEAYLQGMLHLPKELFKSEKSRKSILLIQKKGDKAKQVKQVLLAQIPDFKNQTSMHHFMQEVENWKQENIKNEK